MKIIRITREYTSEASEAEIARATLACIKDIPIDFTTALNVWQRGTVSKSNCCAAVYDIDQKEVRTVDLSYWLNHIMQPEYETVINCEIGQGIFSRAINDQITDKATFFLSEKNPGIVKGNYRLIAYVTRGDGEIADNCELMKAISEFYGELKAIAEPVPELEPAPMPEPEPEPEPAQLELEPEPEKKKKAKVLAWDARNFQPDYIAKTIASWDRINSMNLNKLLFDHDADNSSDVVNFFRVNGLIGSDGLTADDVLLIVTIALNIQANTQKWLNTMRSSDFYKNSLQYYSMIKSEVKPELELEPEAEAEPKAKLYISTSELAKRLNIDDRGVRMFCNNNVFRYHKSPGKGTHTRFTEEEADYNMRIWQKIQEEAK